MLTPSQRLSLFEEITDGLRDLSFEQVRLVLRTFGLSPGDPYDNWDGGFDAPMDYLQANLVEADEPTLRGLLEHAGGPVATQLLQWDDGYIRVFLSHLASEKQYISQFKDVLGHFGFTSFVAHEDITPSIAWRESIEAHLASADLVIAFVHPHFFDSEWTDQELGWTLGRSIPLISLLYDVETPLRGFIGSRQAILVGEKSIAELVDEISHACSRGSLQSKVKKAALKRLLESRSFAETRDAATLLDQFLPNLTVEEAEALTLARESNNQIAGYADGVRAVRSLLKNAEKRPAAKAGTWDPTSGEPF